jgi:CHAT domain-containing protein
LRTLGFAGPEKRRITSDVWIEYSVLAFGVETDRSLPAGEGIMRNRVTSLAALLVLLPGLRAQEVPAVQRFKPERDTAGLQRHLPPGTVYVVLLRHLAFNPGPGAGRAAPACVGFVVARDRPAAHVELGSAEPIEQAVRDWRTALTADRDGAEAAGRLRRLVWEPLARHFPGDTRAVYLSPDGLLGALPWPALPGDGDGTVLLERYAFALVPDSATLLAQLQSPRPAARGREPVLVVGGVNYDAPGVPAGKPFAPLPGAAREARQIQALAGDRPVVLLSGAQATVERVQAELPRARVAHLATHGFSPRVPRVQPWSYGLALAGANAPEKAGPERGILGGEGLVNLALEDLHLCVLRAGDSGLGEVVIGEGTFNLPRALHLAGCANVVASVLPVSDETASALTAVFYYHLWEKKEPPLEALRHAQLTVYRHPDKVKDLAGADGARLRRLLDGPLPETRERTPAKDWAGFVLSGSGR